MSKANDDLTRLYEFIYLNGNDLTLYVVRGTVNPIIMKFIRSKDYIFTIFPPHLPKNPEANFYSCKLSFTYVVVC